MVEGRRRVGVVRAQQRDTHAPRLLQQRERALVLVGVHVQQGEVVCRRGLVAVHEGPSNK